MKRRKGKHAVHWYESVNSSVSKLLPTPQVRRALPTWVGVVAGLLVLLGLFAVLGRMCNVFSCIDVEVGLLALMEADKGGGYDEHVDEDVDETGGLLFEVDRDTRRVRSPSGVAVDEVMRPTTNVRGLDCASCA